MALDSGRIEGGETFETEFKREYSDGVKKTVAAFANTAGGMLYIGIDDDGTVVGVANPDETMLQVNGALRSGIKPDLTVFVDCKAEKIGEATVIAVTVQKGTACPYYLAGKGIRPEGVFVRHGASSVPASETAILSMIKETDGDKFEEMRSLNQKLTFETAKRFFDAKDLPFTANHRKTLYLQTTDGIYTNLGLLLSDQSAYGIRLAVFDGTEKAAFRDRREFTGSILAQVEAAYDFLEMHNRNRAKIEGLFREDRPDYPEGALREALLNAVVHRDYAFSGSTLVSLFDDRIEIVSAGGLPKGISLEDILLGLSMPQNEKLAGVFYRLGLIEAYGTGIPRIIRGYADCAKKPDLQATANAFKVTLPNRNTDAPPAPSRSVLSENEAKVMALLDAREEIVRGDVQAALGISQAMAVRVLRSLVDKEALRVIGGGTKTRYGKRA